MLPLADDGEFKHALLLQSAWGLMGPLGDTKDLIELDRMDDAVHQPNITGPRALG